MNSKGVLASMAAIIGGAFLLNHKGIKEAETVVFNARKPKNKTRIPYAPPEYQPITGLFKPLELKNNDKEYNWKKVITGGSSIYVGGWNILANTLPICRDNPVVNNIVNNLFNPIVENILEQKLGSIPMNMGMQGWRGKMIKEWALKYPKDYADLKEIPQKAIDQLWNNKGVTADDLLVMLSNSYENRNRRRNWMGVKGANITDGIRNMISTNKLVSNKIENTTVFKQMLNLLMENMKNLNWISTENEKLVKWMEITKRIEDFEEQITLSKFPLENLNNKKEIELMLKNVSGNKFSRFFYPTPMTGTIRYRLVSWFIRYYNALDNIPFGTKFIYLNIRNTYDAYQDPPNLQRYDNKYSISYYHFEDSQNRGIYEFKDGKFEIKEGSVVTKVFATKEFFRFRPVIINAIKEDIKLYDGVSAKRKDDAYETAVEILNDIPATKMYRFLPSPYLVLRKEGEKIKSSLFKYKNKLPPADLEKYKNQIQEQLDAAIVESEKNMLKKHEERKNRAIAEEERQYKEYINKENSIIEESQKFIDEL